MGVRKSETFVYTEKNIRRVLNAQYLSNPRYLLHNLYVFGWESDFLVSTKAMYWYEVEIKISLSDFKRDFEKRGKHEILRTGGMFGCFDGRNWAEQKRPHYFSYCAPEDLAKIIEPDIPDYAGLIGINENGRIVTHKAPPRLHAYKYSDEELRLCEKFYYNLQKAQSNNMFHDEKIASLRAEISFLKAEFKAVAGYDVYDY